MDGDLSLPSLFANFLLCNSRDVCGVVCKARRAVPGEALGAAGCSVRECPAVSVQL